jgi:hypothetical protein
MRYEGRAKRAEEKRRRDSRPAVEEGGEVMRT